MGKVQYLYCDGSAYLTSGGSTVNPSRDDLASAYGTYIPGILPNSVGLVNTTGMTELGNGQETINIASNVTLIENTFYKACVNISAGTQPLVFKNCKFVANNAQLIYENREAGLTSINSRGFINFTARHVTFIDCEFDHGWWFDQGLSNRVSTFSSFAIHGGHFTLERCLLRRFTDMINFAGRPNGNGGYVLVEASRFADQWFGPSNQSGGITHSDAFQFNTGHSVEIRNSYLGGDYVQPANPGQPGIVTPGANNAVFMIQQENDAEFTGTANWLVEDFFIHDNWIHGAAAGVNLNNYVSSDSRYNTMAGTASSGCRITGNRFAARGGTNKNGFQIRRTTSVQTYLGGNVTWTPGGNIYGNGIALTEANGGIVVEPDEA